MLRFFHKCFILLALVAIVISCKKTDDIDDYPNAVEISIFTVNDQHGQLNNYAKVRYIVEQQKKINPCILVSGGDIFSGNPVVDYYPEKGYPMIDVMNRCGFDVAVVGNHEYDYGEAVLKARMEQAEFEWVCANVDMNGTGVPQPHEYYTMEVGELRVTFLGLVETNGKDNGTIPSTHPFRVENFVFSRPENVVTTYSGIKAQEEADLYIALTHLGHNGYNNYLGDYQLAQDYPYFDLIIGGHSHSEQDTEVNGIPIFQAGSYLNKLGRIDLLVDGRTLVHSRFSLIDLNAYNNFDNDLKSTIDGYNESMSGMLDEVIGYAHRYHSKSEVGCFYTDALRQRMDVDVCFQNSGGIRGPLAEGDITVGSVYAFDPFNNNAMYFEMSVGEIKNFLKVSGDGFYYSGIKLEQSGNSVIIRDMNNNLLDNQEILSIGINDYIPAVHDMLFPNNGETKPYTTAEAIMYYLTNINDQVDYQDCGRFFRYQ